MNIDELRAIPLFEGLRDQDLQQLIEAADVVHFEVGDELFHENRPADYWWVLLEGALSLVRRVGSEETTLGVMATPGQWAGGFQAWEPNWTYLATARGTKAGRLMRVPAGVLGERAIDWFPLGSHLIAGLVRDIRTIDSITRQREALVALGTLAAGLAHEMNNPASAATRAVAALEKAAQSLVSSQGRLAKQLSTSQLSALDDLRRETRPSTGPSDALELSDREEDLSVWLNEHGVDGDWEIAPPLAAAGLDARWCERVSGVLDGASLGPSFEWIAASLATTSLVSEVKDSTTRISDLVAAVRSYSQLDRASLQQMDLVEGLESTLVMLGHKLRGGITIERDYAADVPPIEAIAGELNQVWTNVIDNAVDAMNGSGTLRISTRNEGESVSVEIRDTGEGMSEDARAHAFDPFFTTKDIGKGTGLGLDISRRIVVDRHGGEITIDSQPGETIVRVRLPVAHKK